MARLQLDGENNNIRPQKCKASSIYIIPRVTPLTTVTISYTHTSDTTPTRTASVHCVFLFVVWIGIAFVFSLKTDKPLAKLHQQIRTFYFYNYSLKNIAVSRKQIQGTTIVHQENNYSISRQTKRYSKIQLHASPTTDTYNSLAIHSS